MAGGTVPCLWTSLGRASWGLTAAATGLASGDAAARKPRGTGMHVLNEIIITFLN